MFNESLLYFGKEGCTSITKQGSSNQSCTNNKKTKWFFQWREGSRFMAKVPEPTVKRQCIITGTFVV